MSSHSSCRCSEQHGTSNGTKKWASLQQHIHPNHRDRRKDNAYTWLMALFEDAAQVLALLATAVCARIIQTYGPVPPHVAPSIDRARSLHLTDLSTKLYILYRWVGDNLEGLLRKVPRSEAFERTAVRLPKPLQRLIMIRSQARMSNSLTELLSNPPPPLFFAACLCFAWALSFVRQSHLADRYQDRILSGGVAVGVLVAAVQSDGFLMDVKGYLAWTVVLASVGSIVSHRLLGFWSDPRTKETVLDVKADKH